MSGELNRFDDIFHEYDDDLDEQEDVDIDFLQHFSNPSKDNDDSGDQINVEQQLSQKLSQLSASNEQQTTRKRPLLTPTSPESVIKKFKNDLLQPIPVSNEIPNYLSFENQMFEELVQSCLQGNPTSSLNREDLQDIAHLEHKLALLNLHISFWKTHFDSGTGELMNEDSPDWQIMMAKRLQLRMRRPLCIWPEKLKSIILADPQHASTNIEQINYITCNDYVTKKLHDLKKESQIVEQKLNHRLPSEMNKKITKYIQEYGICLQRIIIEREIAIIKYDYYDELFQSDFSREFAYADQVKIFENLYQSKLNKETAKMELELLKQRVAHQYYFDLFTSVRIPAPVTLSTVQDEDVRQRISYRYQQLLQRTKSDMLMIYIRTAEAKMEEYAHKFDLEYQQFERRQRDYFAKERFTDEMCFVMQQRFRNLDERLQTLCNLKVRFFVNAPTVNNLI